MWTRSTFPANSSSNDGNRYFLSPQINWFRQWVGRPLAKRSWLRSRSAADSLTVSTVWKGRGNPRRGHLAALVVVLAVPDEFGHANEISQGESLQSGGRSKRVQPTRYRVAGVMKVSLRWSREGEGRPRTSLRL